MSHYGDLTKYVYTSGFRRPKTLNVGWLDGRHSFETARPARWLILKLWDLCQYCLMEDRGFHECNLSDCPGPTRKLRALYFGERRAKVRKMQERQDLLRKTLLTNGVSRGIRILIAEELAALEQSLKNPFRGHSKMPLGIDP